MEEFLYNDILVKVSKRKQRRLIVSFKGNHLFVTCPKTTTKREILEFLNKNKEKIVSNISNDLTLTLFGKVYQLKLYESNLDKIIINESLIEVFSLNPKKLIKNFYIKKVNEEIENIIVDVKNKVNLYIDSKLDFNLKYNYAKSFLGRCFYNKNLIEISGYLAKYPKEYFEFVLIHEICHFYHHNHSKDFHSLVNLILKNEKEITLNMKLIGQNLVKDYI